MSVVAGFAADTQGPANSGQGLVSAEAQIEGQGWSGGTYAKGSSSVQDGTENMRSSWRAQFFSFVQGTNTLAATEAGTGQAATTTEQGEPETESATQGTAFNPSPSITSIFAADSALRWRLAAGQGNDSSMGTTSAQPAPENNLVALRIPISGNQRIIADGATKTSESTQPFLSATARDAVAAKSSKRETDSDGPASATAQASPVNDPLSQLLLQAATWAAAANTTETVPSQVQTDSPAASATGAVLSSFTEASVVSPGSGAGTGSPYAIASDTAVAVGNTALSSIPPPHSFEHSSFLVGSTTLPTNSGASGSANSLKADSSASSLNGGQAAVAESSDSVQAYAEGPVDSDLHQNMTQSGSDSGESASASDIAGRSAGILTESQTHSTLAFSNVGARSGSAPPQIHAAIQSTIGETKTPGGSLQEAEADHSVETKSSAIASPVLSSVEAQAHAVDAQQSSVLGQSKKQEQLMSQTMESTSVAASSNESNRATEPVETVATQSTAAFSKARKPAVAGAVNASERVQTKSMSGSISSVHMEQGLSTVQSQTSSTVSDSSSLLSYSAATRDAMSTTGGTTPSVTNSTSGSAGAATFAALDSTSNHAAPSWIHAGARHAEAGFQDPALGWVGVRAEVNAGGVHATVIPGSADAAQALGGHMAGLNAYLSDEHAHVETLTLATPESRDAGMSTSQNSGQGMNQGANPGAGQGSGQNSFSESPANTQTVMSATATISPVEEQVSALSGTLSTNVSGALQQGAHISVMA